MVSLQLDATDAELDVLSYSASGLPPGSSLDASSGLISGTLSPGSVGSYLVEVAVSDGEFSDTPRFRMDRRPGRSDPTRHQSAGNRAARNLFRRQTTFERCAAAGRFDRRFRLGLPESGAGSA